MKISPSQSPLESFGLGGKYKLNRTTAAGFSGFLGDIIGFGGFICHDLSLSPRWKGTLGLLYAKWKNPSGKGEDFLPFFGLLLRRRRFHFHILLLSSQSHHSSEREGEAPAEPKHVGNREMGSSAGRGKIGAQFPNTLMMVKLAAFALGLRSTEVVM